jgi:hypothetical protein
MESKVTEYEKKMEEQSRVQDSKIFLEGYLEQLKQDYIKVSKH